MSKSDKDLTGLHGMAACKKMCSPEQLKKIVAEMSDLERKIAYFEGSYQELAAEMYKLLNQGKYTPDEVDAAMDEWAPMETVDPSVGTVWQCEQARKNGNELAFCC